MPILSPLQTVGLPLPATLGLTWLLTAGFGPKGRATYQSARYAYSDGSLFDPSALTYGTDYALTAWCAGLGVLVGRGGPRTAEIRTHARRLMFRYAAQCFLGGIAHMAHDGSARYLNSIPFRLLWTAVVGIVASTTVDFVRIAAAIKKAALPTTGIFRPLEAALVIPGASATAWGAACWALTALGAFSFKRPAADIFAVGVTQTPATVYLALTLLARGGVGTKRSVFGLFLNSPLVFGYPFVVGRFSLGQINCALHAWLAVAWGAQGLGLLAFCDGLDAEEEAAPKNMTL